MKKHYWDPIPQGHKFESFTGMQGAKQLGEWCEVSHLTLPNFANVHPVEQDPYQQVVQESAEIVNDPPKLPTLNEPGVGLYL